MSKQAHIGIVGTGRMGANIARRLHEVGHSLTVTYDAPPEVAHEIVSEIGAEAAATLARVSELADVIITVVSDDEAMSAIFAPSGDSLLQNAAGKIFVNCATVMAGGRREAFDRVAPMLGHLDKSGVSELTFRERAAQ